MLLLGHFYANLAPKNETPCNMHNGVFRDQSAIDTRASITENISRNFTYNLPDFHLLIG